MLTAAVRAPENARNPRRPIRRRLDIVIMPAIRDPLPHVASHIVKPERIWCEFTDRRSVLVAGPSATTVGAIGVVCANLVAPVIGRLCSTACRILIFSF